MAITPKISLCIVSKLINLPPLTTFDTIQTNTESVSDFTDPKQKRAYSAIRSATCFAFSNSTLSSGSSISIEWKFPSPTWPTIVAVQTETTQILNQKKLIQLLQANSLKQCF